ncbi:MAG: N-6 DNA methylase [Planctomycetes bacterium]|nr:N-6 DNA methylase [Planctomycetota bacterium]
MSAPKKILELVEIFRRNIEAYKHQSYNEAQVRHEFIEPFFAELGWDMHNTQGYAEAYKDVIFEDAIRIGSAIKAPDYCFRIGGTRKFFIEAKKPSINIKDDIHPAFQLRRYAWSAKLPLSILTDFEEFAVYDSRVKPVKTDRASVARIKYIRYTEYADRWNEIAEVFSRENILKGSFDKYAEATKKKRGTAEVDSAFLEEIEKWRDLLAHNIAIRNGQITNRQLNFAVQRTIDRIIFLRICEDRGIEQYARLLAQTNGGNVYQRLFTLFERADERYNSGLFHFQKEKERPGQPDDLSPNLIIDDKPLRDIIKSLYYPDSPYEFSVLPADILGHVYEQFLGKVITLTKGHRAKIEEKPEVKKAGGVYYTPSYIVDYIVQNTVGKLVENKTPTQVNKIKILDPACGSGSFLIGAYQYLLDWHLKWYMEDDPEKHAKAKKTKICETSSGEYKLTTAEKRRILLNNIYGVDIDTQAVEVTKLSLLLKVLEGERELVLFHKERALPDLANNIKCGNSLIESDYFINQQAMLFDEDESYKINAFDWETEFPEIFSRKKHGFDAVIGNPPYGAELTTEQRKYFHTIYNCGSTDTAAIFVEHGLSLLTSLGILGFIIPKPFIYASNWKKLRDISVPCLKKVVDAGKVWREVKLEQCIIILSSHSSKPHYSCSVREAKNILSLGKFSKDSVHEFGFIINGVTPEEMLLASRLKETCVSLGAITTNRRGAMLQKCIQSEGDKIVLGGKNIQRWFLRPELNKRLDSSAGIDDNAIVKSGSILVQNIVAHIKNPIDHIKITATIIPNGIQREYVILDTINQIECGASIHPNYVCGLLNSKIVNWYAYRFLFAKAIRTMHFDAVTTDKIIMPRPDITPPNLKSEMVDVVTQLITIHDQHKQPVTPQAKTQLKRHVDCLIKKVNELAYLIYNLTENEIKLIESCMP